ncbi:DEAD/DEAH box helicase family protein [Streptomyces nigra]|uniref:DEAD/DEAH box helicase family protein n=1 Tax=Streptomyces nigra TaxID=1827580 RepID=UPI0036756F2F
MHSVPRHRLDAVDLQARGPRGWRWWRARARAPGRSAERTRPSRPRAEALFVSATGTGKTLLSIRVAGGLGARLVLFVVPTLDLAVQTALAWRRDGYLEHMVIVSSLDTAGRDDLVVARIMSTTDPHALGGLMRWWGSHLTTAS